ncbi:MAG: fluoride efflux transporter CrcB [Moraxellaceae bacterium]|jgi:CrcB protein|nr:fluoride efflux transporter CrcB [Moraxellaceae bacterium]MBP7229744.1 fluoride efflux transporter CrcB [Moraxellaceae bacterium]MBP8852426.1 fluoride efflux transporter CrcB [Moraxellaceae bacterium]MBP9045150.1 fluoride efflux transporter CrcB [Moraxellaceae bacterium]MBP9730207.1 fluoride efflux transporter CrcB [Moraxellaceae bacterium]
MNALHPLLLVAIGGALGSMARYSTAAAVNRMMQSAFPWGTLVVNVAGSLLIGMLMVLLFKAGEWRENGRFLLVTGMMGGFTTFSSFSWETLKLLEDGRLIMAITNIFASIAICLLATLVGALLARQF